jgi:hypothetical protein
MVVGQSSSSPVLPLHESRVVLIVVPAGGIPQDVFAVGHQFGLIPDNVFVIAALPDGINVGVCPKPFGYTDFEPADD